MTDLIKDNHPAYQSIVLYLVSVLFLLNPLLALLFLVSYCTSLATGCRYSSLYFAGFVFAAFVGLINATKVHENDLIWYVAGYLDAEHLPFWEYLLTFGRNGLGQELAFPAFNYLLFQFLGPNPNGYVFIHSFVSYSLLNYSLIRFGKVLKFNKSILLMGLVVMTFTPYIFAMSAILMRQFLASAILMTILVEKFFYGKKSFALILVMVLTHSVTIFFVPFILYPYFRKPISYKTSVFYIFMILVVLNIQFIALLALPFVQNVPLLQYVFLRASTGTTFDLGSLSMVKVMVSVFTVAAPMFVLYFFDKRNSKNEGLVHFYNIGFILVLFILGNLHQSELSIRLNFFVWQFFPFSFLVVASRIKHVQFVSLPLSLGLIAFFIVYLDYSMWTYKANHEILYFPIWQYFLV